MEKGRPAIIRLNRWLAGIAVGAVLGSAVQAADRAHVVNIYAWESYFPKTVIDKFQSETGMHVNYSPFDSPDAAETAQKAADFLHSFQRTEEAVSPDPSLRKTA